MVCSSILFLTSRPRCGDSRKKADTKMSKRAKQFQAVFMREWHKRFNLVRPSKPNEKQSKTKTS